MTNEEIVEAILEADRKLDEPRPPVNITLDLNKPEDLYFALGMSGYYDGINYWKL